MRSILDDHISSTFLTDYISHLILDLHTLQLFFCFLHSFVQIRVEITDDFFPRYFSLFNHIQKPFHICCEMHIHNTRERLFHHIIDNFPDLGHVEIFSLFCHIASSQNQRDRRSISTRSSNPQFFQCLYKTCLRIMCRRLGKMLLWLKLFSCQY